MNALTGLDKLQALEEIALLKARRDRAADTKDWALYESLHAPDHVSENGDYGRWTTATEMIANVAKSMEHLTTMHHSHSPEIAFETPTRATGIWAMEGMSFWKQGEQDHWFQAFGHYFERYEKRGDRWMFTQRKLEYYFTRKSPGAIFPPKIVT
ncbi:nuclear transport factor 2 family protein [Sphingomonas psychrolutea]|uniref:Bile-acid 7-alpha-dehydratase n=1 Tax=Sphingomonas psychrolutea TaxID=1259676 RepID=A0ABQ1G617_9SPHN|nr:nuclear transport factor 2 family protein [Sphingomonas psychrolutea]GGA37434.1 bile-acid 7-alpha-dehydratase [Sphingomonas psychrolutea]